MTRYHKLYRHSVTTGKCEDCGLIDNHSNACHDAAPIRKIEALYDELDRLNVRLNEERERCARIAEGYAKRIPEDYAYIAGTDIAKLIREPAETLS